jgi:predicted ATPase
MSQRTRNGRVEGLFRPNEDLPGPFEDVTVVEYRGLQNLRLERLGRINLIAGVNNSGKTSLLEALYLLAKQTDRHGFLEINSLRDTSFAELWSAGQHSIAIEAHREGTPVAVQLSLKRSETLPNESLDLLRVRMKIESVQGKLHQEATIDETTSASGGVAYDARGSGRTYWVCRAHLAVTYRNDLLTEHLKIAHDESLEAGSKPKVIQFLRDHLDSGVRNVELTSTQRFLVTHDGFEAPQPLSSFGEGMRRILYLGLLVAASRGGILLIDEVENAIHVSLLKPFTRFLHQLAEEFDVQIFATTHSQEAIEAFLDDPPEDIVAYTLIREPEGPIFAERFDGPDLAKMIDTIGYDIRRS